MSDRPLVDDAIAGQGSSPVCEKTGYVQHRGVKERPAQKRGIPDRPGVAQEGFRARGRQVRELGQLLALLPWSGPPHTCKAAPWTDSGPLPAGTQAVAALSTGGSVSGMTSTCVKPPAAAATRPVSIDSLAPRGQARPNGREGRQVPAGPASPGPRSGGFGVGQSLAHPDDAPTVDQEVHRRGKAIPLPDVSVLNQQPGAHGLTSRHQVEQGHADGHAVFHLFPHTERSSSTTSCAISRPGWPAPDA